MSSWTDEELLHLLMVGDAGARDAFVKRYRGDVYRLVHRIVRRHADADDVTQTVFVRAFAIIGTFSGRSNLRTWLIGIAKKVAAEYKRARKDLELEASGIDPSPGEIDAAFLTWFDGRIDELAVRALVLSLVETLTPEQRQAFIFRTIRGYSEARTAVLMGKTEGAVRQLHQRALRVFRQALKQGGKTP